jgi:predicted transcriptional regulator
MQSSWDKMLNYVSQYDKLFRVVDAAFYTGIGRKTSGKLIREMLEMGMLSRVESPDRYQYYRYNKGYRKTAENKEQQLAKRVKARGVSVVAKADGVSRQTVYNQLKSTEHSFPNSRMTGSQLAMLSALEGGDWKEYYALKGYDTLKRLVKKGYVEKDSSGKMAKYRITEAGLEALNAKG